eukprot:CAMPEP_0119525394 /NCGR_PEP_ID=MMETSP1344-20130328/40193_1 /TAXON_ID=236787 /ORGANISM="Florenciella parvula, Strain CCMP2471" /LENGTH=92 /DNA_ID=CAMNT_0007564153 /DNA_START=1 /DNA_END=276 /DNA_ORIENTATION=+
MASARKIVMQPDVDEYKGACKWTREPVLLRPFYHLGSVLGPARGTSASRPTSRPAGTSNWPSYLRQHDATATLPQARARRAAAAQRRCGVPR